MDEVLSEEQRAAQTALQPGINAWRDIGRRKRPHHPSSPPPPLQLDKQAGSDESVPENTGKCKGKNAMNPFERIMKRHRTLPKVDLTQGRSIAYSRSTTRRMMGLQNANVQGNVRVSSLPLSQYPQRMV